MLKKWVSLFSVIALLVTTSAIGFSAEPTLKPTLAESGIKGNLVIVGGALGSTNADVYNAFIKLAGDAKTAKIGIIPAASGNMKSSNAFKKDLATYGVTDANIAILPIAVVDDSKTKDIDESKWIANANDSAIAEQIKGLNAIWFVGGDQTRITKALVNADGSQSLALKAIWTLYKNGGTIGGTSAGAAIMSQPMLAGGNSLGAINYGFTNKYIDENDQLNGPVYLENGLGFFQYGLVDQHFDARARLGRLAVSAYEYKNSYKRAYGVDENTAMIFHAADKTMEVAGAGGVTILNMSLASKKPVGKQFALENIFLNFVSPGDVFNVETGDFKVSRTKDLTNGYEYYNVKGPIVNTGVFSGYNTVKNFIMYNLVDNEGANSITSYCFDEKGMGAQLIFKKDSSTKGWWGYKDGNMDSYSAADVVMSILPIEVKITPVK